MGIDKYFMIRLLDKILDKLNGFRDKYSLVFLAGKDSKLNIKALQGERQDFMGKASWERKVSFFGKILGHG